jgi:Glycosyl hydrolase family 26
MKMVLKLGRELEVTRTPQYLTAVLLALLALPAATRESPLAQEGAVSPLVVPPERGVYHGAFPDFGATEDRVTTTRVLEFERLVGKRIALASFSDNWFEGIRFPRTAVRAIARTGAVPLIRMMPRSDWRENRADRRYTLARIIGGRFDRALRAWARDARALSVPLMIDFAPEMNGDWFGWSGRWNGGGRRGAYGGQGLADGPERYREAYRHVVDLFRSESVGNVTWIFHVNAESAPRAAWNVVRAYYPGDSYVDWVGVSVYGAQTPGERWTTFTSVLDAAYPELVALSPKKPLMIAEFGVVDDPANGSKADWIARALASVAAGRYPRVRGMSYWHSSWQNADGSRSEMRIDSSLESLVAYRRGIAPATFVARARRPAR